jgi:hypothetical protein
MSLANELGPLTGESPDEAASVLWQVARLLNERVWESLNRDPTFAAFAAGLGLDDLDAGLRASLPAETYHRLDGAGLIPDSCRKTARWQAKRVELGPAA